jgi:hypothetical protein
VLTSISPTPKSTEFAPSPRVKPRAIVPTDGRTFVAARPPFN